MEAGRELDRFVAEKVMGWTHWEHGEVEETSGGDPRCRVCGSVGNWGDVLFTDLCYPYYSTDIASTWDVLEKLRYANDHQGMKIKAISVTQYDNQYYAEIESYGLFTGFASTAPLAICLAALKAVGYNKEEA